MKQRKNPKAAPATAAELAKLLREIVRNYGIAKSPMPIYSPSSLLTAFHLAAALDPSTVQTSRRIPGGWEGTVESIAPPNDEAAKRAHNLKAICWLLTDIMQRWKNQRLCSLQSDEKDKLLALADNLQPMAKALDGPGKEEVGGGAEVPWTDNAPEYLPNSEAVKLAEGRLEVKELGRLLTPLSAIHHMRKGHRCKVHLQDFRRYLTNRPDLESAITDELIDKHLSGIATRKAEIDKQRRTK